MDALRFTTIAHADHELMSPLDVVATDRLLDALALPAGGRVLDVGCGNGAMLIRLVARSSAVGVGIDRNPAMIRRAGERARREGVSERVTWITAEARDHAELARPFEALLCVGATGALGGLDGLLGALPLLLVPGGRALVGDGYWRKEPSPVYLERLGATREEMTDIDGVRRRVAQAGYEIVIEHCSSAEEWDEYEGFYATAIARFVQAHPDDPDAPIFAERIAAWREAYERWGRETLGFVAMVVGARG